MLAEPVALCEVRRRDELRLFELLERLPVLGRRGVENAPISVGVLLTIVEKRRRFRDVRQVEELRRCALSGIKHIVRLTALG